jgi:RNA 2',3'-cyclic 3'-phosphodiesterase
MSLLRAFIAVEIPQHTRQMIERQSARLRQSLGDDLVRWVPSENMHLTLKFLGDVASSHLNFLKQMISQTADSHAPFDLQVGGLGCYPNPRSPRVIWIGIHAPPTLASLQKNIEAGSVRLGYERDERAFSPHLTIGRVRQNANPADLPKVRAALSSIQFGDMEIARVDSVHLFKSDLTPSGSIYTNLFSAPLKNGTQKSGDF